MTQHPFVVNVATLRRQPGASRRERREGPIPELTVTGSSVPEGARVVVEVLLESVHGGILATGSVMAPWVGECRRCLAVARGELRSTVRELFEPSGDPEQTYPLRGDQLDLEPLARDAVLLELPQVPLCTEGCLGLCPVCGINRNEASCSCRTESVDPRWAPLDALRGGELRR
ncbi:MAG TPA: DUF177 domain-containing protein [Actinomycetota bacterium]|jgi:uncharacterized protein|nr:DUF177 domain-containing protein [Actinomycetota bacterium]